VRAASKVNEVSSPEVTDDEGGEEEDLRPQYWNGSDNEGSYPGTSCLGDLFAAEEQETSEHEDSSIAEKISGYPRPLSQFKQELLSEVKKWFEPCSQPFKVGTVVLYGFDL